MKNSVGSHTFFGASPLNFWSNLNDRIICDHVADLVSHGFTSIYLLLPWAVFTDNSSGSPRPVSRSIELYRIILAESSKYNLTVHVRMCYLWESRPSGTSTYSRLNNFFSSPNHQLDLRLFLRLLHDVAALYSIKIHHFFSWEDFYWPIYRHWQEDSIERRTQLAFDSEYNSYHGLHCKYSNNDDCQVAIPIFGSADLINFAQFYDSVLLPVFFKIAAEEGIDVGFEYRVDSDQVGKLLDDSMEISVYYHWQRSHPYIKQKYIYFHQNLSGTNNSVSAESAIFQLEWLLRTQAPMRQSNERQLIIDQFNFIDSTEATWPKLSLENLDLFLMQSFSIFIKFNVQIVLWSYIDWRKDIIHNGQFIEGGSGWDIIDFAGQSLAATMTSSGLLLLNNQILYQKLSLSLPGEGPINLIIQCTTLVKVRMSVWVGVQAVEIDIEPRDEVQEVNISFNSLIGDVFKLLPHVGSLLIHKIILYDRIYSQGGMKIDKTPTPSFTSFGKVFLSDNQPTQENSAEFSR